MTDYHRLGDWVFIAVLVVGLAVLDGWWFILFGFSLGWVVNILSVERLRADAAEAFRELSKALKEREK